MERKTNLHKNQDIIKRIIAVNDRVYIFIKSK